MSTEIILIRHSEVNNPDGIYYGRLSGFHLSDAGILQSMQVARYFSSITVEAIYSSPQKRAIQTAEYLSKSKGINIIISELLDEVYTPYDGLSICEIEKKEWDVYSGNEYPYESPNDILKRIDLFIKNVINKYHSGAVACFTHGDLIAFKILDILGEELMPKRKQKLTTLGIKDQYPANGSLLSIEYFSKYENILKASCEYIKSDTGEATHLKTWFE